MRAILVTLIIVCPSLLFAQMQSEKVENKIEIEVPAKRVWNFIKDFRNFPKLLPAVDSTEVIGKGKNASWTIYLKDGVVVKETTTFFSNSKMTMSYRMTETPMPLENYHGTFIVEKLGRKTCKVTFKTTFEVLPENRQKLTDTFRGVQVTFLNNIEKNIVYEGK